MRYKGLNFLVATAGRMDFMGQTCVILDRTALLC